MSALYDFVSGPLAWITFFVFFFGLGYKFVHILNITRKKDSTVLTFLSAKYGLRSIAVWSTPFAARNMRLNPVMTVVAFVFHICLFLAPLFLEAHVVMFEKLTGISWPWLPNNIADVMTILVILGLGYFAWRRSFTVTARYVSTWKERAILVLVALPFVTGTLAWHQIGPYELMLVLHILTGELLLVAIPFTWLSHMILAPMVRAYMGSEFGGVRHARDW